MAARKFYNSLQQLGIPEKASEAPQNYSESLDYGLVHNRALLSRREEQAQPKKIFGYRLLPIKSVIVQSSRYPEKHRQKTYQIGDLDRVLLVWSYWSGGECPLDVRLHL